MVLWRGDGVRDGDGDVDLVDVPRWNLDA